MVQDRWYKVVGIASRWNIRLEYRQYKSSVAGSTIQKRSQTLQCDQHSGYLNSLLVWTCIETPWRPHRAVFRENQKLLLHTVQHVQYIYRCKG